VAAALRLSGDGGTVVMTRGSRGVLVARDGRIALELSAPAVDAVDTTAAGDTVAGYPVGRLDSGDSLDDSLRSAIVAASLSVTRRGASTSIPLWSEISIGEKSPAMKAAGRRH
jgi:ribokinase